MVDLVLARALKEGPKNERKEKEKEDLAHLSPPNVPV